MQSQGKLAFESLHCPRCGYLLTGLPLPRCPECGEAFDPKALRLDGQPRRRFVYHVLSAAMALAAGPVAACIPVLLHSTRMVRAPLLPVLRVGIERTSLATLFWLFAVSAVVGLVGSLPAVAAALAMVLAFPIITFAEVSLDPFSHNLWPLEILLYALFFPVCLLGASIGRAIRWAVAKGIELHRL